MTSHGAGHNAGVTVSPPIDQRVLPLPQAAWGLAWVSLADQVLILAERGSKGADDSAVLLSMVVGTVVVGWFVAGVLRARPIRSFVVWAVLLLALVGYAVLAFDGFASGWTWIHLISTAVQVFLLWAFCRTAYYRQQRLDPRVGPPLGGILAIAIVVGALGGLTASTVDDERGPQHRQRDGWHRHR